MFPLDPYIKCQKSIMRLPRSVILSIALYFNMSFDASTLVGFAAMLIFMELSLISDVMLKE